MKESAKTVQIKSHSVHTITFLPDQSPVAVVQINHGLAEHSERYRGFATFLCSKGYAVHLHDHPGHGKTAKSMEMAGHLPWKKGWDHMLEVIHGINKSIRKSFPGVPVFIFGHSMGSLLCRHYNATYPIYFKGMILSGTGNPTLYSLMLSLFLVRVMGIFLPSDRKVKSLNRLFYSNFNAPLKNTQTRFDWLSTDPGEVQKYMDDPLCGFDLSLGFLKSLLQGTLQMRKTERSLRFRKNFATLIISGKQDPVGSFGKEPIVLKEKYSRQGFFNTHIQLMDGRHELLNENPEIKQAAFEFIENWMDQKLKGKF